MKERQIRANSHRGEKGFKMEYNQATSPDEGGGSDRGSSLGGSKLGSEVILGTSTGRGANDR